MSLWNYIAGFLLFRWLFGPDKQDGANCDTSDSSFGHASMDFEDDLNSHNRDGSNFDSRPAHYDNHDYGCSQSYDDFFDEQDDYNMMA